MKITMTLQAKGRIIAFGVLCFVGLASCTPTVESSASTAPDISTEAPTSLPEETVEAPSDADSSEVTLSDAEETLADAKDPAGEANALGEEYTTAQTFPIEVSAYTSNELFEADSGGCGMSLLTAGSDFRTDGFIFFNGVEGIALMKLNGELTQLTRTAASGEEFYGQKTSQTFESEGGGVVVDVEVTIGEPGEIESYDVPEGTLTLSTEGQSQEIAVEGDAGC